MSSAPTRSGTGVVIGRFMPPHNGHRYLVNFAQSYCAELTILVCTLPGEPIPGEQRYEWMKLLFPDAHLVHITDQIPEARREVPGSYRIWAEAVRRHMPGGTDFVFASEAYGHDLARELSATFVPVDPSRKLFPISATDVRRHPVMYWDYIPPEVRSYYLKRVFVAGPISRNAADDKLAHDLARHFGTLYVADYAQFWTQQRGSAPGVTDLRAVARAQLASETALARQANRVLFCESSPSRILAVAQALFGGVDAATEADLLAGAEEEDYALYLIHDPDGPVEPSNGDDLHGTTPGLHRYVAFLRSMGRRVELLHGSRQERTSRAINLVNELLSPSDVF